MKYYFAPMEGITNYEYRRIHNKYFNGIDKYYIPFLAPNQLGITGKIRNEIDPENNKLNTLVIPQIISKNAKDTLYLIDILTNLGYKEVNLNFGCPSATVVPRGRGAGMLKDLTFLDSYLNEVFSATSIDISIKIRIGINNESEFDSILNVLNKYPIKELIIHPRTVKDAYIGTLHLNILDEINKKTNFDIIYNGDIKNKRDIEYISKRYPFLKGVMIGRGLVAAPDMFDTNNLDDSGKKQRIINFYHELINKNRINYHNSSLYYEKEIWALLINYFDVDDKLKKRLFKCKNLTDIDIAANEIFNKCKIKKITNGIIY